LCFSLFPFVFFFSLSLIRLGCNQVVFNLSLKIHLEASFLGHPLEVHHQLPSKSNPLFGLLRSQSRANDEAQLTKLSSFRNIPLEHRIPIEFP
jgi:hypothetical protein